jgi:hypothetical protein
MKIKVQNSPHLFRDEKTNAIVNTDMVDYQNYLKVKYSKEQEQKKIKNLEDNLNDLKEDIKDIKQMILDLYNKSK